MTTPMLLGYLTGGLVAAGVVGLLIVGFFALINRLAGTRINGWGIVSFLYAFLALNQLLRRGEPLLAAPTMLVCLVFLSQALSKPARPKE